jgi:hypothetical protein
MLNKLLAGAATAALVALLWPAAAGASHSWNGYHWARTSNPFTLKLGDNVDASWNAILATTSSDWSKSTVLDTTIVPGATKPRTCKATTGQDEVCNARYGRTGWLGVAQIWVDGSKHILKGTVKLNDTYFDTPQYDTTAWRNLVSCQEVGHTLGLDHQDTNFNNTNLGTCMDYTSNPLGPPDNEHPNKHDYDELVTIYTHLDSYTTVGATAAHARLADVGNDASTWGRQVGGSRASGYSTYVHDFGQGNLVVTFAIWA